MEEAGRVGPDADGEEHVADLAHRRVGEHPLDVDLDDRDCRSEQGGDRADDRNRGMRVRGYVVQRMHPPHEIDAGGDHGCGVDQGAHRSGAFHGVREPRVQRELRRLGHRADQ